MHTALALAALHDLHAAFDPQESATNIRKALAAFIVVALALASLTGLFLYGRKGNTGKALTMVLTCLVCLIPVAIAAPIALGTDILDFIGIH